MLTALFSPQVRSISIDSTAPFKDAYQGRIYGKRNAFLKMKMYRVAAYHLIDGTSFESSSPFWNTFEAKHRSDWNTLRQKLGATKDSDPKKLAAELKRRQDLVQKYIPYFTKAGVGSASFQNDVRIARAGSNYWVLKAICERVRRRFDEPERIRSWVEKEIKRYRKYAHPRWAEAASKAYEVTE